MNVSEDRAKVASCEEKWDILVLINLLKGGETMPGINIHVQTSLKRTGKEYREIHEWIDDPEKKGERHDITRILEFGKMFEEKYGGEAAQEYLQHLHDDLKARFGHLMEDVEKLVADTLNYFGVK